MKHGYRNVFYLANGEVQRGMTYASRDLVPPMHLAEGFIGIEEVGIPGQAVICFKPKRKAKPKKQWLCNGTRRMTHARKRVVRIPRW